MHLAQSRAPQVPNPSSQRQVREGAAFSATRKDPAVFAVPVRAWSFFSLPGFAAASSVKWAVALALLVVGRQPLRPLASSPCPLVAPEGLRRSRTSAAGPAMVTVAVLGRAVILLTLVRLAAVVLAVLAISLALA